MDTHSMTSSVAHIFLLQVVALCWLQSSLHLVALPKKTSAKPPVSKKQVHKLSDVADVFTHNPDKNVCGMIVKRGYNLMNIIVTKKHKK